MEKDGKKNKKGERLRKRKKERRKKDEQESRRIRGGGVGTATGTKAYGSFYQSKGPISKTHCQEGEAEEPFFNKSHSRDLTSTPPRYYIHKQRETRDVVGANGCSLGEHGIIIK